MGIVLFSGGLIKLVCFPTSGTEGEQEAENNIPLNNPESDQESEENLNLEKLFAS